MLPVLLDLQFIHFKIYTFGVFLVLAFFWSSFLLWKNTRLTSHKEEIIFDGLFLSIIGGLFLGRLIYVLFHFSKFGFDVLKFILINGYPGLSLFGCLIGGVLTFLIFSHYKKIKFLEIADYASAPLLIGLGIGKLGSFFAGTEVGIKTKFFLSLKYVNFDGYRHLTAFYEALVFFAAAYLCYRFIFDIRREKYWRGMAFFFACWVVSLVYFIFDPIKQSKMEIYGQSVNWAISISLLLTFTLYFLYHLKSKIFSGSKSVTSLNHSHAKKSNATVHNSADSETGGRTEETSGTDPEA
jgi:prolipoprotein diacylglyceryltransferase